MVDKKAWHALLVVVLFGGTCLLANTITPIGYGRCNRPTNIPPSVTKVAVDPDSQYFAFTDVNFHVYIQRVNANGSADGTPDTTFFVFDSSCNFTAEIDNVVVSFTYYDNYGQSMAASVGWLAIGSPNLYQASGYTYSFIDIIDSTMPDFPGSMVKEQIFDFNTPGLGTVVAAPWDGTFIATYYNSYQFAIYQPVLDRSYWQFDYNNTHDTGDGFIEIPADMWFDSLAVSNTMTDGSVNILLTGCSSSIQSGVLVLYKYWFFNHSYTSLTNMAEQEEVQLVNGINACSNTPSAQFPVQISPSGSRAIIGTPSIGYVQLFDLNDIASNYSNIYGSPGFGSAVDFVDEDQFVVSDSQYIYLFSWDQLWNSSAEPTTSFSLDSMCIPALSC
jgi:hypothetical protein